MIISNAIVFLPEGKPQQMDLAFEGEHITALAPAGTLQGDQTLELRGEYLLPGLIDLHTHGAMGHDWSEAESNGIEQMLAYYGSIGVTSVLATTMSLPEQDLIEIVSRIAPYVGKAGYGSVLQGIHLEGPYLNPEKCGAQNPAHIRLPDSAVFSQLQAASNESIKIVEIAPEMAGSRDFIQEVSEGCRISLGHSSADYRVACEAFSQGASLVTHLWNAMPPLSSREPGVIGAAYRRADFVELITDGIHLHEAVVSAMFSMFGENRICIISDSMCACGCADGVYALGGQEVIVQKGKAVLADHPEAIAGSVVPLPEMCRRAVSFGVPPEQVVRAATQNPAKAAGIDHLVGSLAVGKRADLLVMNPDFTLQQVFCGGVAITDGARKS